MDQKIVAQFSRVMLVDDDAGVLRALSLVLKALGFLVTPYGDPIVALEQLRARAGEFDLVVTDLRMPGLDGIGLIREIKGSGISVPCVMISGHATATDVTTAKAAGAAGFLAKPFSPPQLVELLTELSAGYSHAG